MKKTITQATQQVTEKVTTKQALGVLCILLSVFTYSGGLSWFTSWTPETEYIESYRDYDIYYIDEANVYAIDTGGEVDSWNYQGSVQGAKNTIDSWLDGPIYVETYRDFDLYKLNGVEFYYGEGLSDKTNTYDNLANLKDLIDIEYYGKAVYEVEHEGETWIIYQLGYFDPVYWGESGTQTTPEYSTQSDAYTYIYQLVTQDDNTTEEPNENEIDASSSEDENPIPEETGENIDNFETVGEILNTRKNLISGITGAIGIGLIAIDIGARRDD